MWSVFVIVTMLATGQVLYNEHSSDSLPTKKDCEDIMKDRGLELAKILAAHGLRDFKLDLSCEQLGEEI
jgi:hypothetical protein